MLPTGKSDCSFVLVFGKACFVGMLSCFSDYIDPIHHMLIYILVLWILLFGMSTFCCMPLTVVECMGCISLKSPMPIGYVGVLCYLWISSFCITMHLERFMGLLSCFMWFAFIPMVIPTPQLLAFPVRWCNKFLPSKAHHTF